jgi:hypothetical protein
MTDLSPSCGGTQSIGFKLNNHTEELAIRTLLPYFSKPTLSDEAEVGAQQVRILD